jgi:hypothetical protein
MESSTPTVQRTILLAALVAACLLTAANGGQVEDGFESPDSTWAVGRGSESVRILSHERSPSSPHRGTGCERFVIESTVAPGPGIECPIGPVAVIDELRARLWVRANRAGLRLAFRVVLPAWTSRKTGRPVEVLVGGRTSRDIDHWEMLEVGDVPGILARLLPALRLEHGPRGSLDSAVATHLVVEGAAAAGRHEIAIDDLTLTGAVATRRSSGTLAVADPLVRAAGGGSPDGPAPIVEPAAGLARGVLEVDGLPFFPRSIDWNGEPLAALAGLGFNCVRFSTPATADHLAEARRAGLWVICPPPSIPDIDVRDPDALPALRNWDRVLLWDMGSGLAEEDVTELAERSRRVRACDLRAGRPLIASADSGLRSVSRHVDMLVARRTVLGTSLELVDYLQWLRERPRLARPGTPLLATLSTEIDPRAARQAAALSGVGARGLAVDPESLTLAALSAVAAGTRGILFTSSRRIDADDPEARTRAAAARDTNLRLEVLAPWGAAGRFAAQAQSSHAEVQAFVMEAARARVVIAWRCVQGSQVVARRYAGGDVPGVDTPLTVLVPGVPEAHQAWEVAPGGLRPLKQRRVTGGVSVTLDSFLTHAVILFSGEPAVTAHVQERLLALAPLELSSARAAASTGLADAGTILGRLPPQALSGPPPVAAAAMLTEAARLGAEGESLAASDPAGAVAKLRLAAAIAGQFERRLWENGVKAEGSMVASPLTASDASLSEQWQFVAARAATIPGPELLTGGDMERIEILSDAGWRHFARPQAEIRTAVEISAGQPASGRGSLRLIAAPADPAEAPVVLETPPVWVTTPPLEAPAGKLIEVSAQVWVPRPITGSVDGLFVFDSLGGPALGERVGSSRGWRRLVLHRIVPADAAGEPFTLTFAMTGLGEARIDDVSIRTLDRGATGIPATPVVAAPTRSFPGPADVLGGSAPPTNPAPTAAGWPGMNLDWPKNLLPFGQPADAPPPGPGGGTIDPFKRARPTAPADG